LILLYADDLRVYPSIKTNKDAENLRTDINALVERSEMNRLPFNIPKCGKITYRRQITRNNHTAYIMRGQILKELERVRELGIITLCYKKKTKVLSFERFPLIRVVIGP